MFVYAGRIWNHRRAGGLKRNFYMIDFNRLGGTINAPEGGVLIEKIDKIISDPNRSAQVALVASGEHKRYVIATENMKEGDALKSTELVSRSPSSLFSCFNHYHYQHAVMQEFQCVATKTVGKSTPPVTSGLQGGHFHPWDSRDPWIL